MEDHYTDNPLDAHRTCHYARRRILSVEIA